MTLHECYTALEGNYESVIGRLRSERLVQKFALKFLDDPSYNLLTQSMEKGDYPEAFRAAHTLKGVCQNLDFTRLFSSSSRLCDALRDGCSPDAPALLSEVKTDYELTANAIKKFQAEL